ncbi:MAG: protein kinase [Polyangiales bacterium]
MTVGGRDAREADLPRPFGPYELVRRLANGAVAEVWLARARSVAGFEKTVALKMVHTRLEAEAGVAQLLIEEARLTSRLSHRNITQVIDLGQVDGRHYIAMEFVDGMDLRRLLKRLRAKQLTLSPRVAAFIVREVAEGLEHAHRRVDAEGEPLGIVHRDVSPANILVSFDGEVKLSDFGLARSSARKQATQAGLIKGKYGYMAPEQARSQPLDGRADVFSAAAVLYEPPHGTAPYPDAALPVLLGAGHPRDRLPPERHRGDIPEALLAVLRRGLAAEVSQRFANARALADGLNAWLYTQAPSPEMEPRAGARVGHGGLAQRLGLPWARSSSTTTPKRSPTSRRTRRSASASARRPGRSTRGAAAEPRARKKTPRPAPSSSRSTSLSPARMAAARVLCARSGPFPLLRRKSLRCKPPTPLRPPAASAPCFLRPLRRASEDASEGVSSTVLFDGAAPMFPPGAAGAGAGLRASGADADDGQRRGLGRRAGAREPQRTCRPRREERGQTADRRGSWRSRASR